MLQSLLQLMVTVYYHGGGGGGQKISKMPLGYSQNPGRCHCGGKMLCKVHFPHLHSAGENAQKMRLSITEHSGKWKGASEKCILEAHFPKHLHGGRNLVLSWEVVPILGS